MIDFCVGQLAHEIASREENPSTLLAHYAEKHRKRVITPVAAISAKTMKGLLRWSAVPRFSATFWREFTYVRFEAGRLDPPEMRQARLRALLMDAPGPYQPGR
jgi:hypothetical protein